MGFFELFAQALSGFYALIPSYGLAIILLTLTVRLVLLPLTIKQTRSMREMQLIQPEIKKIQAKHKGDRQKMNEEMMALYKEHGVNPFGGCLPLLMQMPVLFGLFYVLRTPLNYMSGTKLADALSTLDGALRANQFLGLRLNCSASGTLNPPTGEQLRDLDALHQGLAESCGSGLVTAMPYLVLVLLMGLTTWYQQKQMQSQRGASDNPQAAQMQMIGRIMPIMLVVISFGFPSGLVMYWLTTNVWTIVQQRIILASAPAVPATKASGKSGTKSTTKGANKVGDTGGKPLAAKGQKGGPQQETAGPPTKAKKPHPSSKKKKRR